MVVSKYKFCPYCGGKLLYKKNSPHPDCQRCGKTFWQAAHTTASCIISDKQKRILLTKRNISPYKGKWDVPGGFLEPDETPIEALRREIKEELGVEIKTGELIGIYIDRYGSNPYYTLNIYYSAKITKGTPRPASDVLEIKWFELDVLPRVAFQNGRQALQDFKLKLKK